MSLLIEGQLFATSAFDAWDEARAPEASEPVSSEVIGLQPYTPGMLRHDKPS